MNLIVPQPTESASWRDGGTLLLTAGVAVLGFALILALPEPAGISVEEMFTTTRDRRARSLRVARQHQPTRIRHRLPNTGNGTYVGVSALPVVAEPGLALASPM